MKTQFRSSFALFVGFLAICGALFAHHGTNASYDLEKQITIAGTVTEFVWSNPHCQIYLDVKDEKGELVHWGVETNSPGQLRNGGWNRELIKPGDHITVTVFPSKAGTPAGVLSKITLADGRVMSRGQQAGQ